MNLLLITVETITTMETMTTVETIINLLPLPLTMAEATTTAEMEARVSIFLA